MTSGTEANLTGSALESFVRDALLARGYKKIEWNKFDRAVALGEPIFSQQYRMGRSIYETPFKIDFVVFHPQKWPDCLAIECKWQQVAGSVDEKFPYMVANLKERSKFDFVILLDGNGYKPGARRWLMQQQDKKFIKLMSMSEFQTWANKKNI